MSVAAVTSTARRAEQPTALLDVYRDDGPLARALAVTVGRALRLPPLALVVVAAIPLAVGITISGEDTADWESSAAIAWLVLFGSASGKDPEGSRWRWAIPPLLCACECVAILWLAALAGGAEEGAAVALLCAVAFRRYDLVYRLRYRGTTPPRWVNLVAGGWDGRVIVVCALLLAGALPDGLYVLGATLGVLFIAESAHSWAQFERLQRPGMYEDEEDEGQ